MPKSQHVFVFEHEDVWCGGVRDGVDHFDGDNRLVRVAPFGAPIIDQAKGLVQPGRTYAAVAAGEELPAIAVK